LSIDLSGGNGLLTPTVAVMGATIQRHARGWAVVDPLTPQTLPIFNDLFNYLFDRDVIRIVPGKFE
jgi:hypothetical protein